MAMLEVGTENGSVVALHYEVLGRGRPVVLVHGWPFDGRSWEPQVAALVEAGYQAVTYDRRGFGRSTATWDGHDYDTAAADLHALVEHLGLRDTALVGFSAGGGVVARYIARQGEGRVRHAVLASSVTPFLHVVDGNPEGGLDDATIAHFEAGIRADRPGFVDQFVSLVYSAKGRPTVSDPQRRRSTDLANDASARATAVGPGEFGRTDFRADLTAFTVPTLVVHGDSDAVVPFQVSGRRTASAVPQSELVLVEDAPHGLTVSHAEAFNRALLAFLAR